MYQAKLAGKSMRNTQGDVHSMRTSRVSTEACEDQTGAGPRLFGTKTALVVNETLFMPANLYALTCTPCFTHRSHTWLMVDSDEVRVH